MCKQYLNSKINSMQKILLILLLLCGIVMTNNFIYASWVDDRKTLIKKVILKKIEIEKEIDKWKIYIKAINNYFTKYNDNEKALRAISNKVIEIKPRIWTSKKDQQLKLLIEYIEYKSNLSLSRFPNKEVTHTGNILLQETIEVAKKQILSAQDHSRFKFENLWYSALAASNTLDYNYMNEFTRLTWWKDSFIHNIPDNECYFYTATNNFIWDDNKTTDFVIMGINKETKEKEYYSSKNDIIIENLDNIDCEKWPQVTGFLAAKNIWIDDRLNHALKSMILTLENQKVIDNSYTNLTWSNFKEMMIATNFSSIPSAIDFLEKQWCVFYWKHTEEDYASFLALYNTNTKEWSYESFPNISPIVKNDFYSSTSCDKLPKIDNYNVIKVLD